MTIRHYLEFSDLDTAQTRELLDRARRLKQQPRQPQLLAGRSLAMIFAKSSTRTRISFEVGMTQMGGHALYLSDRDTQLGRGEPIADSARVISRMADAVMIRNDSQVDQALFAQHSQVPVINGLSDQAHPCQILADVMTYEEHRGSIQGRKVAWVGDANNVSVSLMHAASVLDFELHIAAPSAYSPSPEQLAHHPVTLVEDPADAVGNADLVVTDVWASMGQEGESEARMQAFANYQVDAPLMRAAKPDALFMHCLPAHRGEEVAAEVIDGPQSVVWDEAENRLHAQKALLTLLLEVPSEAITG